MIFNDTKAFETAQELIDFFQKHHFFKTKLIWEAATVGRGWHIYRGQSDAEWKLTAKVFRSHEALRDFTAQIAGVYDKERSHDKKLIWLGLQLHAELHAVFMFLETADKLGIETPINYSRVKDHNEEINNAFNNIFDDSKEFPDQKWLDALALAQHHGIPTRLIDWTESPLIACFFAAYNASSVVPEQQRCDSKEIAVFCFHVDMYHRSKSDHIKIVNAPRYRNNFLRQQQGVFIHLPKANSYFLEHEKWPSLEDIVEANPKLHGVLKKYCLPSSEADNLLRILYDYDITNYRLMPTLDNVAKSFSYKNKLFPSK